MRRHWIKVTGSGDHPFTDGDWAPRYLAWREARGGASLFPRRPRIEPGHRLVLYAAGSHRVFGDGRLYAVEEVLTDPEPSGHPRWSWQVTTRLLIAGPRLEHCPTLADVEVDRRSLGRHSHIRLRFGHRAEVLLERAATRHGALIDPER